MFCLHVNYIICEIEHGHVHVLSMVYSKAFIVHTISASSCYTQSCVSRYAGQSPPTSLPSPTHSRGSTPEVKGKQTRKGQSRGKKGKGKEKARDYGIHNSVTCQLLRRHEGSSLVPRQLRRLVLCECIVHVCGVIR